MADRSPIEWTDTTWQIVTGCSVVSPGCTNCYAMRLAGTRMKHHPSRAGLTIDTKAGPVWNGQVRFNVEWLTQPLRWTKPRMIFVAAHGDVFHEGVTDDQLDQIFAVAALCHQHTFQFLTKRPGRMRAYIDSGYNEVIHDDVRGHQVWREAYRLNRAVNPASDARFTDALGASGGAVMIVVTVHLASAADGRLQQLARMHICNDGAATLANPRLGDYVGETFVGRDADALAQGRVAKRGEVRGWRRHDFHVWNLVRRMLEAMGYDKGAPGGAAEAFDALTIADNLIQHAFGDSVPAEWNRALRMVTRARARRA